jgi:hypothetical protein
MSSKTFQQNYCETYKCPPEKFAARVMWQCLHPAGRKLARRIKPLVPLLLATDVEFLRNVADYNSIASISNEIQLYREQFPVRGFLRKRLNLRISGQLVINLASKLV